MDFLKKLFPLSFGTKDVAALIIKILVYLVVAVIGGAILWLAGFIAGLIPVVGTIILWALGVVGTIIDIYAVAGIIITILNFCKVI